SGPGCTKHCPLPSLQGAGRRGNAAAARVLLRPSGPIPLLQHGRSHLGGPTVLQGNPANTNCQPPAICFVLHGFDGGLTESAAWSLHERGWTVHALCCGDAANPSLAEGLQTSRVEEFEPPPALLVPSPYESASSNLAHRVHYALEQLHKQHHF